MSALRDSGLLDVEPAREGSSEFGAFRITAAGREAIARFRERGSAQSAQAGAIDTSWERLHPILVVLVELWEQLGARDPVDTDTIVEALANQIEAADVRRALELLEHDDWLAAEFEMGSDGPTAATPGPKALQRLRGWPTEANDTAIVRELLEALDHAIENASDPEEKTRLRKLREAAGDVSKSVLAGTILAAGKALAGG